MKKQKTGISTTLLGLTQLYMLVVMAVYIPWMHLLIGLCGAAAFVILELKNTQ